MLLIILSSVRPASIHGNKNQIIEFIFESEKEMLSLMLSTVELKMELSIATKSREYLR